MVRHCLDASRRFLEDSVLKDDSDVVVRSPDDHASEIGGTLNLIVLSISNGIMSYKSAKSTIAVYKLVVMDGDNGVFKAHLNTSLSKGLRNWTLKPGCTVFVKTWNWIWCDQPQDLNAPSISRGILLIHDFAWRAPPSAPDRTPMAHPALVLGDESTFTPVHHSVVEHVEENSYVAWMMEIINENDHKVMVLMTNEDLRAGLFIPQKEDRVTCLANRMVRGKSGTCDYLDVYLSSSEDEENARQCKCSKFGLAECIRKQCPMDVADGRREATFEDAISRVEDSDRLSDSFDHLPPSKKRWCMCWWHSVNVFQVRGGSNRKQLPACFVDMVRDKHPNDKGEFFTGHKHDENCHVMISNKRARHLEDLSNNA